MEFMSLYFRFVAKQLLDEHDDEHEDARSTPALEPFLYADEKQKHSYTQISAHVKNAHVVYVVLWSYIALAQKGNTFARKILRKTNFCASLVKLAILLKTTPIIWIFVHIVWAICSFWLPEVYVCISLTLLKRVRMKSVVGSCVFSKKSFVDLLLDAEQLGLMHSRV